MNEPQWNQEAETFARVWQRVSPDLDASPIQPAPLPALPPGDQRTEVSEEGRHRSQQDLRPLSMLL